MHRKSPQLLENFKLSHNDVTLTLSIWRTQAIDQRVHNIAAQQLQRWHIHDVITFSGLKGWRA